MKNKVLHVTTILGSDFYCYTNYTRLVSTTETIMTTRQLGDIADAGLDTEEAMDAFYRACKRCDDDERRRDNQEFR